MTQEEAIKRKLTENAVEVDALMKDILREGKPALLYEAARHPIESGGKRLRPYLAVKSCEAVGGNRENVIPFAAAMELLHSFTLVHDDIMDSDELRRGRPTVHAKWGIPVAIAVGDLLYAKVFEAMTAPSSRGMESDRILQAIKATVDATISLCEGQTLDITYSDSWLVTEEDYIFMVGGKTGALFRACARIGSIVGGGTDSQTDSLGCFAWNAGVAFQIIDDILGVISEEEELGKPVGSDLREGKKTLIVLKALEVTNENQIKILKDVFGDDNASDEDLFRAVNVLCDVGAVEYARCVADDYAAKAKKYLLSIPESKAREDLYELLEYLLSRSY